MIVAYDNDMAIIWLGYANLKKIMIVNGKDCQW